MLHRMRHKLWTDVISKHGVAVSADNRMRRWRPYLSVLVGLRA